MRDFKVGDRVVDTKSKKKGIVYSVGPNRYFPITVHWDYEDTYDTYTVDGRDFFDKPKTLKHLRKKKKMEKDFVFEVGDEVDWLGIQGIVSSCYLNKTMSVKFESLDYTMNTWTFFCTGKLLEQQKESCLKLIKRPKKVKKTIERWLVIHLDGMTSRSCYLSKEQADLYWPEATTQSIKLTGEYEVEE